MSLSRNTVAILCVIGAASAFSVNDLVVKLLSGDFALHLVILFRAGVALVITLAVLVPLEGGLRNLRTSRPGGHILRATCMVLANTFFFAGLAALPIALAVSVFFVAPLLTTILSAVVLREHVGPWRWSAVIVGLGGVLLVVQPGGHALQPALWLPVAAAACYAVMQTMTRRLGATESASTLALYVQCAFVVVSICVGLTIGQGGWSGSSDPSLTFLLRAWVWPAWQDALAMAGLGLASTFGAYLMSQGYRMGEAALVAPFEYTSLVLAVIWGILVWGEWPDALSWAGFAVIIGSGLVLAWRESRVKAARMPGNPP